MYFNDFSIKEVNAYYARRGGSQMANIGGRANMVSFSGLMEQAAAARRASAAARTESGAQGSQAAQNTSRTSRAHSALYSKTAQTHSAAENRATQKTDASSSGDASTPPAASGDSNICCEQCHAANQLMLQMMSRNLYSQSALGYPLTGYGSWTAYQNMANMLGNTLF
ncbi:MAG: hypothetical protein HFH95_05115 [Lachnospiraceae bacterium]|nr:hypothetical protein [Lachnospiraceae bacterium]